jgi:CRISPR-associated protein Cas1
MKSLIVDTKSEKVEYENGKIRTNNHAVPTKFLDLLIVTEGVAISPKTMLNIANENIPLLLLSKDSKKMALTLPAIAKNADLKIMQYKALANHLAIAKYLLSQKFLTHKASLEAFDIVIEIADELEKVVHAMSTDELMGIEGAFARRYFKHYFALFKRNLTKGYRSKNPPLDPVNAVLSYIYTLGYNTLTAKLYMRGFDPSISYLHTPFRSHYALSSDLLEPLRAEINTFVAKLFLEEQLTTDDFTNKGGVYLKYESRRRLWTTLAPFMKEQNKAINKHIVEMKKMFETNTTLS